MAGCFSLSLCALALCFTSEKSSGDAEILGRGKWVREEGGVKEGELLRGEDDWVSDIMPWGESPEKGGRKWEGVIYRSLSGPNRRTSHW